MNDLFDGFRLITKPGIKRYVVIPLLINTGLFIGLFFVAKHFFHQLSIFIMGLLPPWLQWLHHILWIIFFIGFLLIILYTFVTIANIIAAPFNSLLAEKVKIYITGHTPEDKSFKDFINDIPRTIARQFAILGYFIPRAVVFLLLFFIPVAQIIAPFVWFLFNAWLMTLQYVDYPCDNERVSFADMRNMLEQKRMLSLSFGIGTLVLLMIPFLNFIVMPAAVAGATSFWLKEFHQNDSL
jgi:CysZ protein